MNLSATNQNRQKSMFQRIPEPELMNDDVQVDAYASADFSESHNRLIAQIGELFPSCSFDGTILNLGCGSGDDAFRFAKAFPKSRQIAVDGAPAMIERARRDLQHHNEIIGRIEFITAYVPSAEIPSLTYAGIISNSLLHHMHKPDEFWKFVADRSSPKTPIFVADLRRPASLTEVDLIVSKYAEGAPDILKKDFYNSLCAAFTEQEIRQQLDQAGLGSLSVLAVGDRHIVVYGTKR